MYATVQDVRNALSPNGSADDQSNAASLSPAQLEDSIVEAMGTVDAYVLSQFQFDQDAEPAQEPIRSITRDIAAYLATLVYRRGKDVADTDPVYRRYRHAMMILTDIAAGKVVLVNPDIVDDVAGADATVVNLYSGTLFGPGDLNLGYGQPSDPNRNIWPGY